MDLLAVVGRLTAGLLPDLLGLSLGAVEEVGDGAVGPVQLLLASMHRRPDPILRV